MKVDIDQIREMASDAHSDNSYGPHDYDYHLERVEEALRDFGYDDPTMLAGAWLHDTVEDTDVTREDISETIDEVVADLVWRVTDEEGDNRAEKKRNTYPKMTERDEAVVLKLADRIANVRQNLKEDNMSYWRMYRDEHGEFYEHLYDGSHQEMWDHLHDMLDLDPDRDLN